MTDIVERLRWADRNSVQAMNGSRIFGEAADEIERLRGEIAWVRERMGGFCAGSWETGIAARMGRALEQNKTGTNRET